MARCEMDHKVVKNRIRYGMGKRLMGYGRRGGGGAPDVQGTTSGDAADGRRRQSRPSSRRDHWIRSCAMIDGPAACDTVDRGETSDRRLKRRIPPCSIHAACQTSRRDRPSTVGEMIDGASTVVISISSPCSLRSGPSNRSRRETSADFFLIHTALRPSLHLLLLPSSRDATEPQRQRISSGYGLNHNNENNLSRLVDDVRSPRFLTPLE
ncbi:hypothetical protein PENTCL1PPCAC_29176 [Pristionchus entomophagus]|uniref:Ribosomal protein n=1 Tax=Pristionchus entomophagus TaxID=358040 RepID=A0AAV5UL23_9BILA|nr:hypothetical protein PENTCL1PPCAC_29176 [Pristionchus entomophagus]